MSASTEQELIRLERERDGVREKLRVGGYTALSSFMASDSVFGIFRKFDNLATRSLLFMQDDLAELEERLEALDKEDLEIGTQDQTQGPNSSHANLLSLHSRRLDANTQRKHLMSELRIKLSLYREHSACLGYSRVRFIELT